MAEIIPFVDPETESSNLGASTKSAKHKGLGMGTGKVNKLGEPSRRAFGKKQGSNTTDTNFPVKPALGENHLAKEFGKNTDDMIKKFNNMGLENTFPIAEGKQSSGLKLKKFTFSLPHPAAATKKSEVLKEKSPANDDEEDFPEIEHCHPDDTRAATFADLPVDHELLREERFQLQSSPERPESPPPAFTPPGSPLYHPNEEIDIKWDFYMDPDFDGTF